MADDLKEQLSPLQVIEREELAKAFRDVLASAAGKRVVFWMLEQCAMGLDAYQGENNATNYTLGQQAVGRRVIWQLDDIDPRTYPALLLARADLKAMDIAAASKATAKQEIEDDE